MFYKLSVLTWNMFIFAWKVFGSKWKVFNVEMVCVGLCYLQDVLSSVLLFLSVFICDHNYRRFCGLVLNVRVRGCAVRVCVCVCECVSGGPLGDYPCFRGCKAWRQQPVDIPPLLKRHIYSEKSFSSNVLWLWKCIRSSSLMSMFVLLGVFHLLKCSWMALCFMPSSSLIMNLCWRNHHSFNRGDYLAKHDSWILKRLLLAHDGSSSEHFL